MATERLVDDPALVERARAMRAAGATYKQIKSELNVGTSTVSRLLGTTGQGRKPRIAAETRARAETMRAAGRSVTDIAQELDIARSTAWHLTRATPRLPGTSSAIGAVRRSRPGVRRSNKIRRQQTKHRWAQHVGDLTGRELLLVGAAIYWAEGAKDKPWRHDEALTFVNSDPLMITVFLRWLDLLGVDRSRLTFRLQIHESADVDAALCYWAKVAAVPVESFKPTTLKRHNPLTTRRNVDSHYHGCLTVRVRRSAAEYRAAEGLWIGTAAAAERTAPGLRSKPDATANLIMAR
jgi:hypothetical protein